MKLKLPIRRNSKIYKGLYKYFNNDNKIALWFIINNPELNGMKPEIYLRTPYLRKLLLKLINEYNDANITPF